MSYPAGIAGDPVLEAIFDIGFTGAAVVMSEIYDEIKQEANGDPKAILIKLDAFFATVNVKIDGGSPEDQAAVAEMYGDPALAEGLRKGTIG